MSARYPLVRNASDFSIGGAVEDVRLQVLPAYFHLDRSADGG
jgi:hypothetical protein